MACSFYFSYFYFVVNVRHERLMLRKFIICHHANMFQHKYEYSKRHVCQCMFNDTNLFGV